MDPVKLVCDKNVTIRYVYHISDIHIRNKTRHEEYYDVFEKLYQTIDTDCNYNREESLIVITGDILHIRDNISAVSFDLTCSLFVKLSSILPVVFIAGNHDKSKCKIDDVDILSVIMDNCKKLNNAYYIKDRGFYQFHNILFGYSDLYNESALRIEELNKKKKHDDMYKIALYHGIISKCKTDTGYKLRSKKFKSSDFDGYDYGFFGDIHMFQYVNDAKTMAYSGSLIQQDFGESLENHGVLKWDLKKKKSEFMEIDNTTCYCLINVVNGKIVKEDLKKIPAHVTKPNIILISDNTQQPQLYKIEDKLKRIFESCTITTQIKNIDNVVTKTNTKTKNGKSLIDACYNKYIDNYLNKIYTDSEKIEKIKTIHSQIYKTALSENDDLLGSVEKLEMIELRFSNMFSYGKDNLINFSNYVKNEVIGIIAPNHYGKSAILDIIVYCLFQKCARGNSNIIMSSNEKQMSCSLTFRINNKTYLIERSSKRNKRVVPKTNFYKHDGKQFEIIAVETEANNKIIKLVGSYDDYITSYFCSQGKNDCFMNKSMIKRKEYLSDVLKLNVFDYCYDIADNKVKKLKLDTVVLNKEIKKIGISRINDQVSDLKLELSELKKELVNHKYLLNLAKMCKCNNPTYYVYNNLSNYKLDTSDDIKQAIDEVKKNITEYNNIDISENIKNSKQEIDSLKKEKREISGRIETLNEKINSISRKIVKVVEIDNEDELQKDLVKYKKLVENGKTEILRLRNLCEKLDEQDDVVDISDKIVAKSNYDIIDDTLKKINKSISLIKHDDKCKNYLAEWANSCKKKKSKLEIVLKAEGRDVNEIMSDIKLLEGKNKVLSGKILNIDQKLDICVKNKSVIKKNNECNLLIDKYKNQLKTEQIYLGNVKNDITKIKKSVEHENIMLNNYKNFNNILSELELCQVTHTMYNIDRDKYNDAKREIETQVDEIRRVESEIETVKYKLDELCKIQNEYEQLCSEYNEKYLLYELYSDYKNMVHVNGLPYDILTGMLPQLTVIMNNVLRNVTDIEASFSFYDSGDDKSCTNKKTRTNIDITIKRHGKNPYSASLASGFEKFIVGIATRIAICSVTSAAKPNVFVVDEGWGNLDADNLSNIDRTIAYLKNQFDHVIIISHIDQIKDQATYIINIDRENNISHVNNC